MSLNCTLNDLLACIQEQKAGTDPATVAMCEKLESIVANTAAITGIETAFGQLGCIWDRTGETPIQTGSVLVCKVSPEDGGDPITQVHAYFTDGTVDSAYEGEWEPCTDLSEMTAFLESIDGTLADILTKMCEDAGACVTVPLLGNWCDITLSDDPDTPDDVINASNVLIFVETCGSTQTLTYFTAGEGGSLLPYTPVGTIADCDTYEEPAAEPPVCPDGAVFEQVCIPPSNYGILDNSNWDGAPTVHLKNGTAMGMDLIHADGTITSLPVLTDPYFSGFIAAFKAALPDCTVLAVCANHTSPKGCHPKHVANLALYPAYDAPTYPADVQNNLTNPDVSELWATGWLLDCAGCTSPIVRAEIRESSDPAWVGIGKDIITYTKPDELTLFRAITCDGVFWKDCNGADVPTPSGGCCAKPCGADGGELLELLKSVKLVKSGGVPDADYEGAFQYINGRPDATASWELVDNRDPTTPVIVASGADLAEFVANMEALGYSEWSFGEQHYFCPCPAGLTSESTGAYFVNVDGVTTAKLFCEPLSDIEGAPDKVDTGESCALSTCDLTTHELLQSMVAQNALILEKLCSIDEGINGECPITIKTLTAAQATFTGDIRVVTLGTVYAVKDFDGITLGEATAGEVTFDAEASESKMVLTKNTVVEADLVKAVSFTKLRVDAVATEEVVVTK